MIRRAIWSPWPDVERSDDAGRAAERLAPPDDQREAVSMSSLREALRPLVDSQLVPGLVAAVGRGGDLEVVVLGDAAIGGPSMREDALFRIASISKPMMAAVALTFVADGTLELDQPVDELLPELATPRVVCGR